MKSPSQEVDIDIASMEQVLYELSERAERRRRKKGARQDVPAARS